MNFAKARLALAALALASASSQASAAVIHPVGVTTTDPSDVPLAVVDNLINGSGLSLPNASITDGNVATVTHDGVVFGDATTESVYTTPDPNRPTLTFDLGGTFSVKSAYIWNYHATSGFFGFTLSPNGTSRATISFQLAGLPVGPTVDIYPSQAPTTVGVKALPSAHLLSAAGVTADKIFMTLDDHFSGGDRIGLGEVRFSTVAVPEPGTVALLAIGLGGCLFLRRRGSSPGKTG